MIAVLNVSTSISRHQLFIPILELTLLCFYFSSGQLVPPRVALHAADAFRESV